MDREKPPFHFRNLSAGAALHPAPIPANAIRRLLDSYRPWRKARHVAKELALAPEAAWRFIKQSRLAGWRFFEPRQENGDGFTHYFFYDGADSWPEALEGLREFGAPEQFGRALSNALRLFEGGRPPTGWDEREEAVTTLEETETSPFGPMDSLFLGAYDGASMVDYAIEYVKKHPAEFFRA